MAFLDFFAKKEPQKYGEVNDFSDGDFCLKLISENYGVENPDRYEIFEKVLNKSKQYSDPLHILACAYAYHYSRAELRMDAISYFEKYLENPVPCKNPLFNISHVYRDLGKDYEAEYNFNSAEKCYKNAILKNGYRNHVHPISKHPSLSPEEVMLGRLYLKVGTQKAVEYWESFTCLDVYRSDDQFRRRVDIEYKNATEKHAKGYVYKPRKNNKENK